MLKMRVPGEKGQHVYNFCFEIRTEPAMQEPAFRNEECVEAPAAVRLGVPVTTVGMELAGSKPNHGVVGVVELPLLKRLRSIASHHFYYE